jgi:hypothetical protein
VTIQVNFWDLVMLLLGFFAAVAATHKFLFSQFEKRLSERFTSQDSKLSGLEESAKQDVGQWQRVERELLNLKADLPLHYVRREDYIRGQSVIEAKLDGLALKMENVVLKGVRS